MLIAIDNQVDPSTGTVKFRAEFANKDNALFPSQFVNVRLRLETEHGVVLIPTAAVQRGTQGTFVYLVKPDKTVAATPVKLGTTEGEIVSVDSGLKEGDQIVTDGSDSLRDGAKVELADLQAAAKAVSTDPSQKQQPHKHKKNSDNQ
jgi:multidrug efflux system membrane fusion protein